jgi:hypothetical protein
LWPESNIPADSGKVSLAVIPVIRRKENAGPKAAVWLLILLIGHLFSGYANQAR